MLGLTKRAELQACLLQLERLETRVRQLEEQDGRDLTPLETRLERLELDHGQRHVDVLNTLEKVTRQLTQRERKRDRVQEDGADGDQGGLPPAPPARAPLASTAHLARRFRGF